MSVVGDCAPWRDTLLSVYDIVREAVIRTWPDCSAGIRLGPTRTTLSQKPKRRKSKEKLEDPITRDLIRRLRMDDDVRTRFHVESQRQLIEVALDRDADPTGYNDIAILFFIGSDEACLALECKRLNVTWKSRLYDLAKPYVRDGMMRFVAGQYSKDFAIGGMIGYVMDGDVAFAQESVLKQIEADALILLCDPSKVAILTHPDYFSSTHARTPNPIELRHQLLAV